MVKILVWHEKPIESIDHEKIIINADGKFPKRIILMDNKGHNTEYRLVKTQSGGICLNK
jgi:hypothetical protein